MQPTLFDAGPDEMPIHITFFAPVREAEHPVALYEIHGIAGDFEPNPIVQAEMARQLIKRALENRGYEEPYREACRLVDAVTPPPEHEVWPRCGWNDCSRKADYRNDETREFFCELHIRLSLG